MNKNLQAGLVIVGVVAAILLLAYAAQAAGLTSTTAYGMPGRGGMGAGYGMMGQGGGMMAMMHGGQNGQFGSMMDPSQMPHWNQDGRGTNPDCPYLQSQQTEQ